MRVGLTYSTEIENIPYEIERLLLSVEKPDVQHSIEDIAELVVDNNCVNAMIKIDELRKQLGNLDHRLQDCHAIISGYTNAMTKKNSTNEPQTDEG